MSKPSRAFRQLSASQPASGGVGGGSTGVLAPSPSLQFLTAVRQNASERVSGKKRAFSDIQESNQAGGVPEPATNRRRLRLAFVQTADAGTQTSPAGLWLSVCPLCV